MDGELALRILCTGIGVACLVLAAREAVTVVRLRRRGPLVRSYDRALSRSFGWFLSSAVAFGTAALVAR